MKISFNAYREEYEDFKKVCKEKRTTPTAMFVQFIRDVVQQSKKTKKAE